MFAQLFDRGEFASSHLFIVLATAIAFLALQLLLCFRFCWSMRRQQNTIEALSREDQLSHDNQNKGLVNVGSCAWVQWVVANYAPVEKGLACNFSREDALHELDARIVGRGDYLLLQRMGVMAPLLGVVLTVVGFFWLEIGDQEQSLQAILLAVAPLVSGVGAGAILALINQALLHFAGHRAESLRQTARAWFDSAVWSQMDFDLRAAAVRAVSAMDQLTASLGDASTRYSHGAGQINESTGALHQAASQFQQVVQQVGAEIQDIPMAFDEAKRTASSSAEAITELIQVGSRAVANLDLSVAAFRTTIDREFTAAVRLHRRARRALAKLTTQFEIAAEYAGPDGNRESGEESTQRLAAVQEALVSLEDALVAIKQLSRGGVETGRPGEPSASTHEGRDSLTGAGEFEPQGSFLASIARRPR